MSEEQQRREWDLQAALYDKNKAAERAARRAAMAKNKRPRASASSKSSARSKRAKTSSPKRPHAASVESLKPLTNELLAAMDADLMAIMAGDDEKKAKKARKGIKMTLKSLMARQDLNVRNLKESGLAKALHKLAKNHLDEKVKQYANAKAEWNEMIKNGSGAVDADKTVKTGPSVSGPQNVEVTASSATPAHQVKEGGEGDKSALTSPAALTDLAASLAKIRNIQGPLDKPTRKKVKKWLKTAAEGVTTGELMQSSGLGKIVKKLCKHPDEKVSGWCKNMLESWMQIVRAEAAAAAPAEAEASNVQMTPAAPAAPAAEDTPQAAPDSEAAPAAPGIRMRLRRSLEYPK